MDVKNVTQVYYEQCWTQDASLRNTEFYWKLITKVGTYVCTDYAPSDTRTFIIINKRNTSAQWIFIIISILAFFLIVFLITRL